MNWQGEDNQHQEENQTAPTVPPNTMAPPLGNGLFCPELGPGPLYRVGHCHHYPYYPIPSYEQLQIFLKMYESQMGKDSLGQKEEKTVIKQQADDSVEILTKKSEDRGLSCQCTKSHCLKEYCYCFKNGAACGEKCGCESCKNDQD